MSTAPKTAEVVCMARERQYCRRGRLADVSLVAYRTGMRLSSRVMERYRQKRPVGTQVGISIIQYDRSVFNRFFYFYVKLFQRSNFL